MARSALTAHAPPRPDPTGATLAAEALACLMPMYLLLDAHGFIQAEGPTCAKLGADGSLVGQDFFARFHIRRPCRISVMPGLLRLAGERLHLDMRGQPGTRLRGVAVPTASGGAVINLSFGIDIVQAVREHDLTDADFAPTDLCVELLYLVEANAAVLAELRGLNQRLHGAKRMAEELAATDALTGLGNRRALNLRLDDLLARSAPLAVMQVDLDYFKQVNDRLGHAAGDHVLTEVARILREETRGTDSVARTGGDEFVILLPGPNAPQTVTAVAERICARLQQPITFGDATCQISASAGVYLWAGGGAAPDADDLLARADRALYAAKRAGRGCVHLDAAPLPPP